MDKRGLPLLEKTITTQFTRLKRAGDLIVRGSHMKCSRCNGNLIYKKIPQMGKRKPALRGKWICEKCGHWPLAAVTEGIPNKSLNTDSKAAGRGVCPDNMRIVVLYGSG